MTPRFTLRLERQGGLAGIPMSATVSGSELEEHEAARLWALVDHDALAAAARTSTESSRPTRPDSMTYRLVVETPDSRDEYVFGEDAVEPPLQPLIEHLETALRF
jgi:hypothetical protein